MQAWTTSRDTWRKSQPYHHLVAILDLRRKTFFGLMKGNVHETTKQLDAYLANTSTSMDILKSVPTVFNLFLKLNTPLPASAACERMFSTAGHIFSAKRGRLGSKSFENQLLLKLNQNYW